MPDFTSGSTDPTITPDPGAGPYNIDRISADTMAFKLAFYRFYAESYVIIGDDATLHMRHYLGNTGRDYTIDLENMISDVPSALALYERELASARRYVEGLTPGNHAFTSSRAVNGYNTQGENRNWFFAIGGYSVWSKGTATVTGSAAAQRSYQMNWTYKFFDRYNWDGGKSVNLFGFTITDAFMGRMHREGIAREFNCNGSVTRQVSWRANSPTVQVTTAGGGGGR